MFYDSSFVCFSDTMGDLFLKDLKLGMKNINTSFIVLEVGKLRIVGRSTFSALSYL